MHWLWVLIVGAIIGAIGCHYEQRSVNGVAQQHHCRIDWFFAWRSTPWVMGTPACWDGHNSVNYWRDYIGSTCFIYYVPLKHG